MVGTIIKFKYIQNKNNFDKKTLIPYFLIIDNYPTSTC